MKGIFTKEWTGLREASGMAKEPTLNNKGQEDEVLPGASLGRRVATGPGRLMGAGTLGRNLPNGSPARTEPGT